MFCSRAAWILLLGLTTLCMGLAGGTGCAPSEEADAQLETQEEVPRNVRVLTIAPADMNEYLSISGRISPVRGTDLFAEEAGQVEAIPNDKGSLVSSAAVLVQLDDDMLQANLNSATANRELASYNESRTRQLFDANSVSRIEMLDAETKLKGAEAVEQMAKIRYDNTAIRAPFAGIVSDRYVEIGQLVSPGMPVARIADPHTLKLVGSVSEREVDLLKAGDTAEVFIEGRDRLIPATIYWVGFEANPTSGKFTVELHLDNADRSIRPGVVGTTRILKSVHEKVIQIPRDAILQRAGISYVYVVDGNHAYERAITVGRDQGLMTIITDGLNRGDQLVVRGQRELRDSSAVAITETAQNADGSHSSDPNVVTQGETVDKPWQAETATGSTTR
jgi:membrane fusion protein, multidrug efflux system